MSRRTDNDSGSVVVVGSCNTDLISYVSRRPERGETVLGNKFQIGFGGKGANQAVAASRLGVKTCMVGKVGNDSFGKDTINNFKENGVNTDFVLVTDEAPTGAAPITVEESGENSIIVNPGANDLLTSEDVRAAAGVIQSASVVICQGEVPLETTLTALKLAKSCNVLTVLNPAPANAGFNREEHEFYKYVDILCPNESECESLCGLSVTGPGGLPDQSALAAALDWFLSAGCRRTPLITLGEHGAAYRTRGDGAVTHVRPPRPVLSVVDTTGAGDAFVGSLVYYLAQYQGVITFREMVARANHIAGLSVQRPGTQTSFPRRAHLPQELFDKQPFT